ncbi:MAG: sulfotransferase [Proteobacteria bacterium]|nr:sulfotransferase [Pseudomonadota bacterium]
MKVCIQPPQPPRLQIQRPAFVIVGMMRSGSNFLERTLNLLPSVRCHGELFNPKFIGLAADLGAEHLGYHRYQVASRRENPLGMLRQLIDGNDRQTCGFRLFLDHEPLAMAEVLYHPGVRKVLLTRNYLESFVSLLIARRSNIWLTTHKAAQDHDPRVHVDVDALIEFTLRQSCFYNDVLTILHSSGQDHMQIDYSEIKSSAHLNRLTAFLGVSDRVDTVEEPIERQNPGAVRDKILNFQPLVDALRQRGMARWFV